MPLDTPTLKRKANDEATKTLDWFNDLADKLGERHAPKIRALGALLEDEHWCGVLRDVKENIRKDDMEMALTSEKVGTGKGALKQIEKYMDHTFLDLSKAPESAFAVKPESASKGCILEPTFKVKKELPVGSAADGEPDRVPMQSISRFVPNLLKRLRCKAPKSRALEHLDVAEASLFYWLYLVAQCSTPYGDGLRLEDAVTAFDNAMPKIPLRGTAAKNEMANPGSVPPRTWKPILEGIIHNVTKSAFLKAHKEKPLKLHPSDIVDEEAFNQLIEQGLPIVLDEREMPRFSIVVQSSNDNLNKNGGSAEEEETGAEPGGEDDDEDDDEGDDVPLAQRAAVLRSTSSGGTFTRGGGGVVADDELPPLPQTGEATGDAAGEGEAPAGEGEGEAPPKPPAKKPAAKNRTKQTAPAKQTVPAQKTAPAKKTAPAMKFADSTPGKDGREVDEEGELKVDSTAAFFLAYEPGTEFVTDWYVGTVLRYPKSGKHADIQWANGDPKLWMAVTQAKRGITWVLLKQPEDVLAQTTPLDETTPLDDVASALADLGAPFNGEVAEEGVEEGTM